MSTTRQLILATAFLVPAALAQQPPAPQWQTAAGGTASFEAASLRPAAPNAPYASNVDLDASDYFRYHGGLVNTDGILANYIIFAFKITDTTQYPALQAQLPKWAQSERFILQARPPGKPSKDQLRLMVQALLTERFHLALHFETRQLPVYLLTLDTPGKPGPQLRPHPADVPCNPPPPYDAPPAKPPAVCYPVYFRDGDLTHMKIAGWTMEQIAGDLATTAVTMGGLDSRPILDRTGLAGTFDIDLTFLRAARNPRPSDDATAEPSGPSFVEALKPQTGLKLSKSVGPVQVVLIDRVDQPSEN